jgi:hypothetical protein
MFYELEFIIIIASSMSLVALSIDTSLPAISDIRKFVHILRLQASYSVTMCMV